MRKTERDHAAYMSRRICQMQKLQEERTLREDVSYSQRVQHVDKAAPPVKEDNRDYDKTQETNHNKKKGDYLYVTLLVNNTPIKLIIESGSPVTIIPHRLFHEVTKVEKMNTHYKDVNDNKIEFIGQLNATVKTNTTSLQLPLLITKANITPLVGLDWMKGLKITKRKHRIYQNTHYQNRRNGKENPQTKKRIGRSVL